MKSFLAVVSNMLTTKDDIVAGFKPLFLEFAKSKEAVRKLEERYMYPTDAQLEKIRLARIQLGRARVDLRRYCRKVGISDIMGFAKGNVGYFKEVC